MNYFEFYGMSVSFLIDESRLKKKFFELSRKFHPDFYLKSSEEEQTKILELASLNNKAFKTLNNIDSRIKYVLELKGMMDEEEKYQLPKDFLAEMMELNEELMEVSSENNKDKKIVLEKIIHQKDEQLFLDIQSIILNDEVKKDDTDDLKKIKDYYFKKKYLWRLKETLNKFES